MKLQRILFVLAALSAPAFGGPLEESIRASLKLPRSIEIEKIVVSQSGAQACVVSSDPASGKRIAVALQNAEGRWMIVAMPATIEACATQYLVKRA